MLDNKNVTEISNPHPKVIPAILSISLMLLVSCGGGTKASADNPLPSSVSIDIAPKKVTMQAGQTEGQTFKAIVSGSKDIAVNWSIAEGLGPGGTINNFGIYFPPTTPGVFHVIATSAVDPTKSATAIVSVTVGLEISPAELSIGFGEVESFSATVIGTTSKTVTWAIQEGASGGSITSGGTYTAPQMSGTFHVVVTSQADNDVSAIATVNVGLITVTISPPAITIRPGGTLTFIALVPGTEAGVTWAVEEGTAGGTITDAGFYTAPQSLGTFHVVATSVADHSKEALATVNVVAHGFNSTDSMETPRQHHAAVLLTDGRVLIAGGGGEVTSDCGCGAIFSSAEIFDPASGTFTPTGSMATSREMHTATLLSPSGKVLVAGGTSESGPLASAELFDPATGTFRATASMTAARIGATATLLPKGEVLIIGGLDGSNLPTATAEIFDPAHGTFKATGSMTAARQSHTATLLLLSGKVLVTGGLDDSGRPTKTVEIFDPAKGTFTQATSMNSARSDHTATQLLNGKVLIAGGLDDSGQLATAELFDPASQTFAPTGNLTIARGGHSATPLVSGEVLIAGGWAPNSNGLPQETAELFDPASGTFSVTGSMSVPRVAHTTTRLLDGKILVTGGFIDDAAATASAELFF